MTVGGHSAQLTVVGMAAHYAMSFIGSLLFLGVAVSIYFVIAVLFWLIAGAPREHGLARGAWRHSFPAEVYRDRSARIDFWHNLVSAAVWYPILGVVFAASGGIALDALLHHAFGPSPFAIHGVWTAAWLQFAAVAVGGDLGFWVAHLLSHKVPALWRLHRAHHSADVLSVLTAFRVHPVEAVYSHFFEATIGGAAIGTVLYLTGTKIGGQTAILLAALGLFLEAKTIFDHGNVRISFGPLNRLVNTPLMHQFHHSAERPHWDHNMGRTLAIWDWVFGTLYLPKRGETCVKGISDLERGDGNPHRRLSSFYIEPVATFVESVLGGKPEKRQHAALLAGRDDVQPPAKPVVLESEPERRRAQDPTYQIADRLSSLS